MGKVKQQLENEQLVNCCQCGKRTYESFCTRFKNSFDVWDYICGECVDRYAKERGES